MPRLASESDRRYCRAVLPEVSRTFALNIRLLGGTFGEAVRVGYLMCRAADALEDSWPGTPREITDRFDTMLLAIEGDDRAADRIAGEAARVAGAREDLRLVAHYPHVWRVYRSLPDEAREPLTLAVRAMARGMRHYASRAAGRAPEAPYLDTEEELHHYCYVVAGCVGEMLTRLARLEAPVDEAGEAARMALAPAVGEALQLTNILLDWPADVRRGRCHLPAEWLDAHGLTPRDLVGTDRPEVHALATRLESLARAALARVPDYVELYPTRMVRYRLFCLWPALWAVGSLRAARSAPGFPWDGDRPRLAKSELWRMAIGSALFAHGRGARGMFEGEMRRLGAVGDVARTSFPDGAAGKAAAENASHH
jgi:farnesyl-diphosphate farnesyltransferase